MKIIVLYGDTNSGKTTTLGMVYATLISNGAAEFSFYTVYDNGCYTDDFEVVLGYQGDKIAICSYGDISLKTEKYEELSDKHSAKNVKDLFKLINFYKDVDIIITAYSTKNDLPKLDLPVDFKLRKIKKTSASQDYLEKSIKDSRQINTISEVDFDKITRVQANAKDCHKIISLI